MQCGIMEFLCNLSSIYFV